MGGCVGGVQSPEEGDAGRYAEDAVVATAEGLRVHFVFTTLAEEERAKTGGGLTV